MILHDYPGISQLTIATLELNNGAFIDPVVLEHVEACELLLHWDTSFNIAHVSYIAALPVLQTILISELSWALIALEMWIIQSLHSKSIDCFVKNKLLAAIGTACLFCFPLLDAAITE